jgi:hypothetical protein
MSTTQMTRPPEKNQRPDQDAGGEPGEDHKARVDRELMELLQELRVAVPGVQVLFAFLLTVPFAQGFTKVDGFQKNTYMFVLLVTAAAAALLLTPAAQHRLLFRVHDKEQLLRRSNVYAGLGLAALALALSASLLLLTDYVLSRGTAWLVAGAAAVVFAVLWFLHPIVRRSRATLDG